MSEAGLLADIAENPDDDTPRLVYADWMEERGQDARAALVRIQIKRARLPASDPRQIELARRETELVETQGTEWTADLAACCESWEFRRGFVERISVKGTGGLERDAAVLFRRHPIRELHLSGRIVAPDLLGEYEEMGRIERLEAVSATGEYGGLARLIASPRWTRLREALFEMVTDADGIAEAVADASWAEGLRGLQLSMAELGRDGLRALASSLRLEGLRWLDVSFNDHVGDSGARGLVRCERLAGLRWLDLTSTGLTARGMRPLADEPGLERLHRLEIGYNDLGNSGTRALLSSQHLTQLESLSLPHVRLGQSGLEALAGSRFGRLKHLEVSENGISPNRLRLLLEAPGLERLEQLVAGSNPLGPEGAKLLAGPDNGWPLQELDLRFCDLGDEGAEALAAGGRLVGLETLILHANGIGPAGTTALVSGPWQGLRWLGLKNNRIGREGAAALETSVLPLQVLELETNELPPEAQGLLRRRYAGAVRMS